jgi:hypothetical protein
MIRLDPFVLGMADVSQMNAVVATDRSLPAISDQAGVVRLETPNFSVSVLERASSKSFELGSPANMA